MKGSKNVYTDSDVDNMMPREDIEDHAAKARKLEYNVELGNPTVADTLRT